MYILLNILFLSREVELSVVPSEHFTPSLRLVMFQWINVIFYEYRSYNISLTLGRKNLTFGSINIPESMHIGSKNVSSRLQQLTSKQVSSRDAKGSETDVLYVINKHAKEVKNALEKLSYLDKTYRMLKADSEVCLVEDPSKYIAVPITNQCVKRILANNVLDTSSPSMSWLSLVAATGKQKVPYSTVVLGRLKK